jgi:hypothetical protein
VVTTATVNRGNARLRIYKGITNAKLGITPDVEVARLYQCENNIEELMALGQLVGLSPSWIQNRRKGVAYFDLWGTPLKNAKKLFKVVTREEASQDIARIEAAYERDIANIKKEVAAEYRNTASILKNVGFASFFSKSKGRRKEGKHKGEQRPRKIWKDIELYRYCGGGWHTEKKFPFDEIVTEASGGLLDDADGFLWWVKEHCDRKGGKSKSFI